MTEPPASKHSLADFLTQRPADEEAVARHKARMLAEVESARPHLPLFEPGEMKALRVEFEEQNGTILINVVSEGMAQDPNQIALLLHFALEKMLDAQQ